MYIKQKNNSSKINTLEIVNFYKQNRGGLAYDCMNPKSNQYENNKIIFKEDSHYE